LAFRKVIINYMGIWDRLENVVKSYINHEDARLFKINSCALAKLEIHYATNDSGKKRFVEYSDVQYRFFLMAALHPSKQKYDKLFGGYSLSFCPCCGTNLYDFYLKKRNANDYVNEIEGKTF